ncbi:SRPBCC domain-containing protein [Dyadobacter sp. UP-52]|uniref:SRPBCC domain-containing protein n=1 Tax=Dyadobacter subterraneus TaxID=2773304 RepID=A0ABR9W801_9BACT|nr:SRPBCC domain-containing protein [Dyadobacter subterraneus]
MEANQTNQNDKGCISGVGGSWIYTMAGPDDSRHWARVDYLSIDLNKSFKASDCFCDENGIANNDMSGMHRKNEFLPDVAGTKEHVEITFADLSNLEKILAMGFESGFTSALTNLEDILNN